MVARHFTIIGGGIAGLASGLALSRMGAAASIFEQAAKFEEVGAGLQLGPNAVRALQTLDAWDAVSSSTYAPPAIHIRDGRSGRLLKEITLGKAFTSRFGQPYRVAHRADLHAGLMAALKTHSAVDFRLGESFDYRSAKGDVIAADGINSPTRLGLFPGTAAKILPLKIFRALQPMPTLAGITAECVNLWFYPQGHVVHYPVSGGKKLNLVAVTPGKSPSEFFSAAAPTLQKIVGNVPHWLEWQGAYVSALPEWGNGNVILVGDAAHATLPFLAQGAAMALEDAVVLAKTKLNLNEYQAMRQPRVMHLHEETLRSGNIYHLAGAQAAARNLALRTLPQSVFLQRLAWIYQG